MEYSGCMGQFHSPLNKHPLLFVVCALWIQSKDFLLIWAEIATKLICYFLLTNTILLFFRCRCYSHQHARPKRHQNANLLLVCHSARLSQHCLCCGRTQWTATIFDRLFMWVHIAFLLLLKHWLIDLPPAFSPCAQISPNLCSLDYSCARCWSRFTHLASRSISHRHSIVLTV